MLSAYYADLASYTQDADRVDFSRLSYIVNKFPEGFTVWWIQARNRLYPAGYTGWYYVEESLFKGLQDDSVTNRFFLPAPAGTEYIYLFNYSLAPALNHTVYSRILMQDYGSVISNAPYKGLFCVTVSADGIRIAERFGMRPVGAIKTPDGLDRIYMLCK
ncbi:MAG: hypothetical protein LBG90_04700 [Spirochaetaceae bacterium]|nr:hypothetical protein [Spirochaetaceae bacterium]